MSTFISNTLYELSSPKSVRVVNSWLVVWFGCVVWLSSNAGMGLVAVIACFFPGALLTVVWLAQLVAHRKVRPPDSPDRWLVQKLDPLLIGLAVVFFLTSAPFYARFYLSKSSLSTYVASLESRSVPQATQQVGLFLVRETETRAGTVRLITSNDGMMNDAGLVFSPHGTPEGSRKDVYTHLSGPWWHWRRIW